MRFWGIGWGERRGSEGKSNSCSSNRKYEDNLIRFDLVTCYLMAREPLLLVIRLAIIIIMNRLIRTPTRRLVQIVAQVDVQLLSGTHIPRASIRP